MQAEELVLEGKTFISAKRASELTGYTRDYVGQLARGGKINARRIDRSWFIERESLLSHKTQADQYVPTPPAPLAQQPDHLSSVVSLDGREFISARRAADLFGYNGDYVAQLARDGKIDSKQIGGRWYVDRSQLFIHKRKNDSLLATVQAQAVGYIPPSLLEQPAKTSREDFVPMHYESEELKDLMPNPVGGLDRDYAETDAVVGVEETEDVLDLRGQRPVYASQKLSYVRSEPPKTRFPILRSAAYGVGALVITTTIFVGISFLPEGSMTASVVNAPIIERIGHFIPEGFGATRLDYKNTNY